MKLIAKNTFESEDYGIGLKNPNAQSAKKKRKAKSSLTRGANLKSPEKGAGSGGTGETTHAVVVQDVNSMKFIVRSFFITLFSGLSEVLCHQKIWQKGSS